MQKWKKGEEDGEEEGPRKAGGALSQAQKFGVLENHDKFPRRRAIYSGKPYGRKFQQDLQHVLLENHLGSLATLLARGD